MSSVADATVAESMVSGVVSCEVTRTQNVVLAVVGLVTPLVKGTTTVWFCVWPDGVVTVRVIVQSVLPVPVQLVFVPAALYPVPAIPVTVPRPGDAVNVIPVGAVQAPVGVVQYWNTTYFIAVVEGVLKVNEGKDSRPGRESLIVTLASDMVAACTGMTNGDKSGERRIKI